MMMRSLLAALLLTTASATAEAGVWDNIKRGLGFQTQPQAPTVKVLVGRDLGQAPLEVKGKYNIYDPFTRARLATRFVGKSATLRALPEGVSWGEVFPSTYQIVIVPDDPNTVTVVNGLEYTGSILVYQVEERLQVINEVAVEDYVTSILASQYNDPMPTEALAALAIAIRTEAIHSALANDGRFYHTEANKVGYVGVTATPDREITDVMRGTRHLVLSRTRAFQGGVTPFPTYCLDQQQGRSNGPWSLAKAENMAEGGKQANKILETMYPDATIEMLTSLPKQQRSRAVADNSERSRERAL